MSEYDENRSPARSSASGGNNSSSNDNTLTEDANNSIIGKVKSRVSSIIPNRFSKWFSPSAAAANNSGSSATGNNNNNNNDSINGNLSVNVPRRRRYYEIEDDDEGHESSLAQGEYPLPYHNNNRADLQRDDTGGNSDDDDGDDSNNSDDDGEPTPPLTVSARRSHEAMPPANVTMSGGNALPVIHVRRQHFGSQQPPAKRTRMNPADMSDSPMLLNHHKPLVASTPATTGRPGHLPSAARLSALRHKHLHGAGGNPGQRAAKEAPYNFAARDTNTGDIDIIDLVPVEESANTTTTELSSNRRSLNVPQFGGERASLGFASDLKRLPLYPRHGGEQGEGEETGAGPSHGHGLMASRTSTTIHEEPDNPYAPLKYNGQHAAVPPVFVPHKRAKLMNGSAADYLPDVEEEPQCVDTASESSECGSAAAGGDPKAAASGKHEPRKTGLFNLAGRTGSAATPSGNGLNFFTHLEGRKSLFAGGTHHATTNQSLNSSTLSLNALNRRQFNASIYGSTSALSDSRLLNTFSPFYKGRTTYGGAAAYNKFVGVAGVSTGAGASSIRITPTMIRPTSSLSVLSGSTNSLTGASGGAGGPSTGGDPAPMSNAAKRILDMINDFATPLSEAKKMANNVKSAQYLNATVGGASKGRLNESDLNASRAVRLSQVRTPYKRPSVMLASSSSGTANGKSPSSLPPTRELQVPSMSQLLQLKKMQTATERARHIAAQSQAPREYKLPVEQPADDVPQPQQKHVSKIKNRHNAAARATGSSAANLLDDEPLPPVNLPNIAFPLMQAVPKFDIALPVAASTSATSSKQTAVVSGAGSSTKPQASSSAAATATFAFKGFTATAGSGSGSGGATAKTVATPPSKTCATEATAKSPAPASMFAAPAKLATPPSSLGGGLNFKFSQPLALAGDYSHTNSCGIVYKFSPPAPVSAPAAKPAVPQLKTGSVLDALKKPFLPEASKPVAATTTTTTSSNSFGSQFKKSSAEWECDTCMIRNKQEVSKCVACETPRKTASAAVPPTVAAPLSTTSGGFASSFGSQFKKSSAEWECDTCMIRNKQEASKCVACETPRKQAAAAAPSAAKPPLVASSFGDAFKPKANTWECPTCMIGNKADVVACVACETKKPGAASAATTATTATAAPATPKFSFGFAAAAGAPPAEAASGKMDSKFKSLVAEQASAKWECEACMTRNDNGRSKCVCCEQAKPGCEAAASSAAATAKFSFGSSAAAQKFSFGFGAAAATATTTTQKTETTTTPASSGFVFGSKAAASAAPTTTTSATTTPGGGFSFGLKPAAAATAQTSSITTTTTSAASSKDAAADSTKAAAPLNATFKFGAPTAATSAAATASTGFSFGSPAPAAATTTTTTTSTTNKSDAATTSTETPAKSLTTFSFGSATPTFGTAAKADSTAAGSSDATKTTTSTFGTFGGALSATALPSFGSASTNATPTFGSPSSSGNNNAAPKFAFGATSSAVSSSAAAATTSATPAPTTASSSTGLFSFGGVSGASATAAKTPLFGGEAVSSSSSAAASGNLFGSGSTASGSTPLFGDASKVSSTTATTTTTATFGGFGAAASSTTTSTSSTSGNLFGSATPAPSFGSGLEQKAATPLFGSLAPSSSSSGTAAASGSAAAPFSFGGASAGASAASAAPSASAPSAQWPKSQFVFGSGGGNNNAAATAATPAAAPSTDQQQQKPVFGSFGGSSGVQQTATVNPGPAATSLFGSQSTPASGPPPPFGAASATPVFGANSAASTNVFGSGNVAAAASTTTNTQPPPAFGAASPFGASSGGLGAFGRTATPSATMGMVAPQQSSAAPTFGGFGASNNNNNNNTVTDGASAPKKSEPAFNFGSGQQSSAQGAFQFGAPAAAPAAFNFGAPSAAAPSFNFTGTTETHQQTAKPFQFGATPAPVFGFGSGAAAEATPNAPFQFNAGGAAPAATNIFAPPPIGNQTSAQQARRKIRQPIRRSTPR